MAKVVMTDLALRLRASSAELQKGLSTARGKVNNFQKQTKQATQKIKGQFKQMGSNVGAELGLMGGRFGMLGRTIVGAFKAGVGGVRTFKAALISTGIGAIIVALGTAVGALTSYFKNTKSGADKFNKAMSGIKAVISTLMHRINLLGEAISLVMEGKFKQAAAKAKEAFTGVGKEIKKNYEAGRAIAERENALKAKKNKFIVREAELLRDVKKFREIADDKDKSSLERQAAITKALALNARFAKEKMEIMKEENDLLIEKNALGDNTYEDDQREQEGKAEILRVEEQMYKKMSGLKNLQEQITSETEKEAKEREKIYETRKKEMEAMGVVAIDSPDLDEELDVGLAPVEDTKERHEALAESIEIEIGLWERLGSAINDAKTKTALYMGAIAGVASAVVKMAKDGKMSIKGMMSAVIDAVGAAIQAYLALAIAGLIANEAGKGVFGLVLAAAGVAILMGMWHTLVPDFADGGIVYGETLAHVGEYAGASSNPEVIAPLNKLKSILGEEGVGSKEMQLSTVVSGQDLVFVLEETNRRDNNSF